MAVNTCPKCGMQLPDNAPAGLCPKCLIQAGMQQDDSQSGRAFAETTPPSGEFVAPDYDLLSSQFPQLEILELLGYGGMGAVYKAHQTKLDRLVALKILRPESAGDEAFAERFNREARTLARLSHPNIVAVHDFGEITMDADASGPRELYFFVMEYVDGANLRHVMDGEQLEPNKALAIIAQICEALQFAHDEGVVHRDIKPENVLLDQRGRVKIADFGLAKLASGSEHDFTLTGTHQVMGTPRYMAPEQMERSHAVDHRADIYSLGVVFYEMLTGEVPAGHFDPPSKRRAGLDVRLDDVVLRSLAREPQRRYQSATELKSRVEQISSHPDDESTHASVAAGNAGGLSTILEREAHNAWRWVAGDAGETSTPRRMPVAFITALCVAGCLMLAFPWLQLDVDRETRVMGRPAQLMTPIQRSFDGHERWPGLAVAGAFASAALVAVTTPTSRRLSVWRPILMTAAAAFALLHVVLFRMDLESGSYPLAIYEMVGDREAPELNKPPLYWVDHRITYFWSYYAALGLASVLGLVSAVGVRRALESRPETKEKAAERVSRRYSWTAIAGIVVFVVVFAGSFVTLPIWWAGAALGGFLMTGIGIAAISEIHHSQQRVAGLGLAFFEAVFFPIVLVNGAAVAAVWFSIDPKFFDQRVASCLIAAVLALVIDAVVLTLVWRRVRRLPSDDRTSSPEEIESAQTNSHDRLAVGDQAQDDSTDSAASKSDESETVDSTAAANVAATAIGSSRGTLRRAWDEWWADRDRWFTNSVQTVLVIVFLLCVCMFFTFQTSNKPGPRHGDKQMRHVTITYGEPDPWFQFELHPNERTAFRWHINYFTSSSLILLFGFAAWCVHWQIEKSKARAAGKELGWIGSPNSVLALCGAMMLIAVLWGMHPLYSELSQDAPTTPPPQETFDPGPK